MRRAGGLCVRTLSAGRWTHVPEGPKDPILGVTEAFKADTSPQKLNLGVGAYRDDNGKPVVLPSVLEAAARIQDFRMDNEYSPIEGDAVFLEESLKLALGDDSALIKDKRIAGLQSLSGTGALRLLGAYVARFSKEKPIFYVPNPTWGNHNTIFGDCGLQVKMYKYYSSKLRGVDFDGMTSDITAAPEGSVILFHASAHNPTGADPSKDQWNELSDLCMKKNHLVLFDMAYQGFASGNPDLDAYSVRKFAEDGHDVMLAQSFAKNFGLYGQRVGAASIVTANPKETSAVKSQAKIIARAMYSNPPIHGARIVKNILTDPKLKTQWKKEVQEMAHRIILMRRMLRERLEKLGSSHPWDHITGQIGMFCYSGLSAEQVERLKKEFHIYMTSNGRISMAGLSSKTVDYLAEAIHTVTK